MAGDPLYDPLGTPPPRKPRGWRVVLLVSCLAVLGLAVVGLRLIWPAKTVRDESVAVATIEPAPKAAPVAPVSPAAPSLPARADEGREPRGDSNVVVQPNGDTIEYQHGVKIVRLGGARQNQMITVPTAAAPQPRTSAPMTFKPTTDGAPVDATAMGDSAAAPGRPGPATVPARLSLSPTDRVVDTPRLALMVGGLGLDKSAAAQASTALPPEVSLAFSPDSADLTAQIALARANGHEAILQLPMEDRRTTRAPASSDVLTANAGETALLDRLHRLLGRATGYVGVSNEGGDALLADAAASAPVFKDLAAKGLFFVGNGTGPVGRIDAAARAADVPHGDTDVVVDLSGESTIRASLTRLSDIARLKGQALGYVPAPSDPGQIKTLAAALAAQAIRLVPVGTLITNGPTSSQAKRD